MASVSSSSLVLESRRFDESGKEKEKKSNKSRGSDVSKVVRQDVIFLAPDELVVPERLERLDKSGKKKKKSKKKRGRNPTNVVRMEVNIAGQDFIIDIEADFWQQDLLLFLLMQRFTELATELATEVKFVSHSQPALPPQQPMKLRREKFVGSMGLPFFVDFWHEDDHNSEATLKRVFEAQLFQPPIRPPQPTQPQPPQPTPPPLTTPQPSPLPTPQPTPPPLTTPQPSPLPTQPNPHDSPDDDSADDIGFGESTASEEDTDLGFEPQKLIKKKITDVAHLQWISSWHKGMGKEVPPLHLVKRRHYCVCTDGYFSKGRRGGCGVIIRDNLGYPIVASAVVSTRAVSSRYHQLDGMAKGFELAVKYSLLCFELFCNDKHAVRLINYVLDRMYGECPIHTDPLDDVICKRCVMFFAKEDHEVVFPLLKKIAVLVPKLCCPVMINKCLRRQNKAADYLAKYGAPGMEVLWPSKFPCEFKKILCQDYFGCTPNGLHIMV